MIKNAARRLYGGNCFVPFVKNEHLFEQYPTSHIDMY